ncbi:PAS domain S-box protein [Natrialba swarupiae]|nr:PAS domain S-box protein [Natrialba swarupiae]
MTIIFSAEIEPHRGHPVRLEARVVALSGGVRTVSDDATAVAAGRVLVVGDSPAVAAAAAASNRRWGRFGVARAVDRRRTGPTRVGRRAVCRLRVRLVCRRIGLRRDPRRRESGPDRRRRGYGRSDGGDRGGCDRRRRSGDAVASRRHSRRERGEGLDSTSANRIATTDDLEYADVPLVVVTTDGTITYATPAVDRLGWTPDDLVRSALPGLVHPDDRDRVREVVSGVRDRPVGSTETVTCRLHTDDGAWTVVELTAVDRLEDPDVEGVITTITVAPEVGDETVETALEHVGDPLLVLGERWELVHWTDAAGRLLEGEPEPGTVLWSVLPDDVRELFADRLRESAATGDPVAFETSHPVFDAPLEVTAYPDDGDVGGRTRELGRGPLAGRRRDVPPDGSEPTRTPRGRDRRSRRRRGRTRRNDRRTRQRFRELADDDVLIGRSVDDLFDADLAAWIRKRLESPLFRWMEPVSGDLAVGDGRAVDVFITPLDDDARAVCTVRDRRRSGRRFARASSTPFATSVGPTLPSRFDGLSRMQFSVVPTPSSQPGTGSTTASSSRQPSRRPAQTTDSTSGGRRRPNRDRTLLDAGEAIVSDGSTLEPLRALRRPGRTRLRPAGRQREPPSRHDRETARLRVARGRRGGTARRRGVGRTRGARASPSAPDDRS